MTLLSVGQILLDRTIPFPDLLLNQRFAPLPYNNVLGSSFLDNSILLIVS